MDSVSEQLYKHFLALGRISTDTRSIEPDSLFFALKGDNFDGNCFAKKAVESGAAIAVIDDDKYSSEKTFLVEDVLTSFQQLANFHRRQFQIPVIAITGSNGKTTTKELSNAVLSQHYKTTATTGNLNNHIGVPLTLLKIDQNTEIAIIEMGANHQGEIGALCKIAEPTHGLITNIGRAHLEGFGGFEGVVRAKSELFRYILDSDGEVFVNDDNPLLVELSGGMNRILYGTRPELFVSGKSISKGTALALEYRSGEELIEIETNLIGDYNFENVMAAIALGKYFKVPEDQIKEAIRSYSPSNSRSQALRTERNAIILDAYNANPSSMRAAIENFKSIAADNKMVILGDMLELGGESSDEHAVIVELLQNSGFAQSILVGQQFQRAAKGRFQCFADSEQAFDWLKEQEFSGYSILIKGSRGIKMERMVPAL